MPEMTWRKAIDTILAISQNPSKRPLSMSKRVERVEIRKLMIKLSVKIY
jgi:hypothetical protein